MMLFFCDWIKMWTDSRCGHHFPSDLADDVDAAINVGRIEAGFWWAHPVQNIQMLDNHETTIKQDDVTSHCGLQTIHINNDTIQC